MEEQLAPISSNVYLQIDDRYYLFSVPHFIMSWILDKQHQTLATHRESCTKVNSILHSGDWCRCTGGASGGRGLLKFHQELKTLSLLSCATPHLPAQPSQVQPSQPSPVPSPAQPSSGFSIHVVSGVWCRVWPRYYDSCRHNCRRKSCQC